MTLRERGVATDVAFAVGSTLTIPLAGRPAADAITAVNDSGVRPAGVTTRPSTLDDVYLRLTGSELAAAA
jgi:hypothetical protein